MVRTLRRLALARVLGSRSPRNWLGVAVGLYLYEKLVLGSRKSETFIERLEFKPGTLFQLETTKPLSRRKRRRLRKRDRRAERSATKAAKQAAKTLQKARS